MTAHTDESWAAHRQDRARYDAVHAQLAQIEEGMDSVTNPQARELLEMLQSLLRDRRRETDRRKSTRGKGMDERRNAYGRRWDDR